LLDYQNNYTENSAMMNKDIKNVDILANIIPIPIPIWQRHTFNEKNKN